MLKTLYVIACYVKIKEFLHSTLFRILTLCLLIVMIYYLLYCVFSDGQEEQYNYIENTQKNSSSNFKSNEYDSDGFKKVPRPENGEIHF